MILGSLDTMRRLRQFVVDEASRHLADCIAQETAATVAIRRQAEEIDRQRRTVELGDVSDRDVEAFGQWLRRARVRLGELSGDYDRIVLETGRSRAALTTARAALEAIEILIKEAETASEAVAFRAEQNELDEIAARDSKKRMVR